MTYLTGEQKQLDKTWSPNQRIYFENKRITVFNTDGTESDITGANSRNRVLEFMRSAEQGAERMDSVVFTPKS